MRKSFFVFVLSIFVLSMVSAAVNEYNFFKLGELDSSGNLITTGSSVSGVNVRGFICSSTDCSGSLGDLWGGLYSSGSGMNLVYPTVLASSSGYGFWVYKDGYVPYWVKGVTWYGTGTVSGPGVDRYLTKKQNCVAGVDIESLSEVDGVVSASVRVNSPILKTYGSMYVPSEVVPHLKSSVDVGVEILNSNGVVVWSQNANRNIDFSGNALVPFSANLGPGDYTFRAYTTLGNEPKCLAYTTTFDNVAFDVYDDDKDDDGVKENVDCNDNNAGVWQMLNGYLDSDSDGFGVNPLVSICSGLSLPAGYVLNNNDCNDNNAGVWMILSGYIDGDSDSYGAGSILNVCSGSSLFSGYVSNNNDCNDFNYAVNPGAAEVCGDGIDNDCDGFVDEGCNLIPTVFVSANPLSGVYPLDVSFSCQGVGGDGVLSYSWVFGDGVFSSVQNPTHVYSGAGNFSAGCLVSDSNGDVVVGYVDIKVGMQDLEIGELTCFDSIIEGHNQSCSVSVKSSVGTNVGGVDVDVFYSDGSFFGSCLTDSISGACAVKDLQNLVGNFEVYAVASKVGFGSDDNGEPKFGYEVLAEEYAIVDLKIFSDAGFSVEDYDFFRGEDLFVSFGVEDSSGNVVVLDLISNVSLVSSLSGGRIDLDRFDKVGNVYYYDLISIPVTHDFLGDSNVFAFVFDVVNSSGGQQEVSLIIRNNLPVISPGIPVQNVGESEMIELNLSLYESDVEDSGNALKWEVVSFESNVDVNLVEKILFVSGKDKGSADVVLRLFDLDGDYDEQAFVVKVGNDDDNGNNNKNGCDVEWECSTWSVCNGGVEIRSCFDAGRCGKEGSRPVEYRSCSVVGVLGSDGVISFGELSSENKLDIPFWFWIVVALMVLILLILFLVVVLRGR